MASSERGVAGSLGAPQKRNRFGADGQVQLGHLAHDRVGEIDQDSSGPAGGGGQNADARLIVAQIQPRLAERLGQRFRMRGDLQFSAQRVMMRK